MAVANPKIIWSAQNGHAVLVVHEGKHYDVHICWPEFDAADGLPPPEPGTQMVYPYEPTETATSEEIAFKWGPWNQGYKLDDERPPPPEMVEAVNKTFNNFLDGKGYQPDG